MGPSLWQLLIVFLLFVFVPWTYWRILRKAGYAGWWFLLMFVPLLNLVMVWVFAFKTWPVLEQKGQPNNTIEPT